MVGKFPSGFDRLGFKDAPSPGTMESLIQQETRGENGDVEE